SVRNELQRLLTGLKDLGVTVVLTAERDTDTSGVQHALEEFVADNVVILRNRLEDEKRRRTIEILKFRGAGHQRGEFPFTVLPNLGIVVIPLSAIELTQKSSNVRITSGNTDLDQLRVVCLYPEAIGLEDHLLRIKTEIEDFKPGRVAVDSLSAIERVST